MMWWRKSSYSMNQGECVEVADDSGQVIIRDTTNRDGGTLAFTASAWSEFIKTV